PWPTDCDVVEGEQVERRWRLECFPQLRRRERAPQNVEIGDLTAEMNRARRGMRRDLQCRTRGTEMTWALRDLLTTEEESHSRALEGGRNERPCASRNRLLAPETFFGAAHQDRLAIAQTEVTTIGAGGIAETAQQHIARGSVACADPRIDRPRRIRSEDCVVCDDGFDEAFARR